MALKQFCQLALLLFIIGLVYSTPEDQLSTGSQSSQTITPQSTDKTTGKGEDLMSEIIDVVQELVDEDNITEDVPNGSASTEGYYDPENCSLPANLGRYCTDIPKEVLEYFHNDMSVSSLLTSLLKQEVTGELQSDCSLGNWCLNGSYHMDILKGRAEFYALSPLCSDGFWKCLEVMLEERYDCGELKLSYLVDAVELICDLEVEEDNSRDPECYARTLEALYVTYANLTNPVLSQQTKQDDCSGFTAQMTKTYFHAYDACNVYQRPLLEGFEPWEDIIKTADTVAKTCNINRTTNNNPDNGNTTDAQSNLLEEFLEEIVKETEGIKNEEDNSKAGSDQVKTVPDALSGTNNALLFGSIAFGTVLSIGLVVLAVFVHRRFRGNGSYDKWEYTKVLDEEAKLLRSEYS